MSTPSDSPPSSEARSSEAPSAEISTVSWLPWPHRVHEGPWDVGTEQRWRVELDDGRWVVVGQLAPDLARDESIRRRYVRDAERVQGLQAHALVPILAIGPDPDPRDPQAIPPWRARLNVPGETLADWLGRAPVTLEEFTAVFAGVADAVGSVHATGAVLRDLRPEQIVHSQGGRIVLVDIGLSRVDVLSSHTASSLLMQGSTYAAPEQVFATAVDQRSDLYGLGVMMWQALTGALPFGDGPAFLRERSPLPALASIRTDVPPVIEQLVRACLEDDPSRRPPTAADVAWVLRGGAPTTLAEYGQTTCQHCGASLRVGQRLCLSCGRLSVRFSTVGAGEVGHGIDVRALDEDAAKLQWLQSFIATLAQPPIVVPEFLVGSIHMYAEEERRRRIPLPARLFGQLDEPSAIAIESLMKSRGITVQRTGPDTVRRAKKSIWVSLLVVLALFVVGVLVDSAWLWGVIGVLSGAPLVTAWEFYRVRASMLRIPRFRLRTLPAALPASDPLVTRLAALLQHTPRDETDGSIGAIRGDIREVVGELALLVQRLVDHRVRYVRDPTELDMLTEPVEPLVSAVERLVRQLRSIDRELAELDEGAMVRALAGSEARGETADQRAPLLQGLDRLRALEDRRAEVFHRLLEARSLLTRTVELGLGVHDEQLEHDRQLAIAVAALGE